MSKNGEIYTAGKNFTLNDGTDKFHLCKGNTGWYLVV